MTKATTPAKASTQASIFGDAGIDLPSTEFFSVDGKTQKVRILAVRKPTLEDSDDYFEVTGNKRTPVWKRIKSESIGGPDRLPILAVADVEKDGRPLTWEISANRLARALDAAISTLPATVTVKKTGSGLNTEFQVAGADE